MLVEATIKTVSEANNREHWAQKYRRAQLQKLTVAAALNGKTLPKLPAIVTLTRIGKRKLDSDNLAISFKACRDQIAKIYGVDDGSDLYEWRYAQRIGKQYGIEILVESRK